jgi:hypothetical protein
MNFQIPPVIKPYVDYALKVTGLKDTAPKLSSTIQSASQNTESFYADVATIVLNTVCGVTTPPEAVATLLLAFMYDSPYSSTQSQESTPRLKQFNDMSSLSTTIYNTPINNPYSQKHTVDPQDPFETDNTFKCMISDPCLFNFYNRELDMPQFQIAELAEYCFSEENSHLALVVPSSENSNDLLDFIVVTGAMSLSLIILQGIFDALIRGQVLPKDEAKTYEHMLESAPKNAAKKTEETPAQQDLPGSQELDAEHIPEPQAASIGATPVHQGLIDDQENETQIMLDFCAQNNNSSTNPTIYSLDLKQIFPSYSDEEFQELIPHTLPENIEFNYENETISFNIIDELNKPNGREQLESFINTLTKNINTNFMIDVSTKFNKLHTFCSYSSSQELTIDLNKVFLFEIPSNFKYAINEITINFQSPTLNETENTLKINCESANHQHIATFINSIIKEIIILKLGGEFQTPENRNKLTSGINEDGLFTSIVSGEASMTWPSERCLVDNCYLPTTILEYKAPNQVT